jgi:hypothetical protein
LKIFVIIVYKSKQLIGEFDMWKLLYSIILYVSSLIGNLQIFFLIFLKTPI